jgi:hypothetical protein
MDERRLTYDARILGDRHLQRQALCHLPSEVGGRREGASPLVPDAQTC